MTFPDILYAVVGERLVVPEGLTPHYRRWASANGIGHWAIHPKTNEFGYPITPLKRAVMRFQASAFAFHLLVDVDQADYLGITDHKELSETYGAGCDPDARRQGGGRGRGQAQGAALPERLGRRP